jgi:hypothetical protein
MSWVKEALVALEAGKAVQVRPQGGSMRGRIESGQLVTIAPVTPEAVKLERRRGTVQSRFVDKRSRV